MIMENTMLLETYLKQLRLPTFLQNYAKFAEDAARASLTYDRYLSALAEQEVAQREENRKMRRIKAARFPVLKELADFDFSCVPGLNKQRVLELARGEYLSKAESIILVGNPGLGKTHIATGLALAACRQGHRVRFYNAAGLVHNPGHADHRFRWMPSTHSGPCRPTVPTHGVQLFLDAGIDGRLASESVDGMLRNPEEHV
jgi:DNA replication protein DnaC